MAFVDLLVGKHHNLSLNYCHIARNEVGQTDEFLRQQRACAAAPPDIIVINLGGTDLGHTKGTALVSQMRVDLAVVIQMFPGTTVVYYDILQQRSWMFQWGEDINKCIKMARHPVNQMVFAFLHDRRMPTIHHPAIKQCVPGQYHREGMHLTDEGNDLFLESLRAGLSSVLFKILVFLTPFFPHISWYPIGSYSLVPSLQLPYGLVRGEGREPCVL